MLKILKYLFVQLFCVLYRNEWCLKTPIKNLSLGLDGRNLSVCCKELKANFPNVEECLW